MVRWAIPPTAGSSHEAGDEGSARREDEGLHRGQTFLQAVDTVRLVGADGSPVCATELVVGMRVMSLSHGAVARHKGEIVAGGAAWEK